MRSEMNVYITLTHDRTCRQLQQQIFQLKKHITRNDKENSWLLMKDTSGERLTTVNQFLYAKNETENSLLSLQLPIYTPVMLTWDGKSPRLCISVLIYIMLPIHYIIS